MNFLDTPARPDASGYRQKSEREHEGRPAPRTPRFIFGPPNPSSSASAPRFTAGPRFVFRVEKNQNEVSGDEIDVDDADSRPTQSLLESLCTQGKQRPNASLKDEIPDSEDDEGVSQDETCASPSEGNLDRGEMAVHDSLEVEYDLFFPPSPTQPENKRPRLSVTPCQVHRGRYASGNDIDSITGSSQPESSPLLVDHDDSSTVDDSVASPPARRLPSAPLPAVHTQFNPPSSLRPPRVATDDASIPNPRASSPQRKPRFILPLSPSRQEEGNRASASCTGPQFSPTLKRSSRSGRSHPAADLEYIPGGMASEVRNWILELNARKQVSQYPSTQSSRSPVQLREKYLLIAEIGEVNVTYQKRDSRNTQHTVLGHAASATLIIPSKQHPERPERCCKILLFGTPLSWPAAQSGRRDGPGTFLSVGNWVGIRRGMTWGMEISESTGPGVEIAARRGVEAVNSEKWLVGVEWDILPSTAIQTELPTQGRLK
ncbi:hypothetical protein VTO42DRAFT_4400 [Malbranchea cinnamomea]